MARLARAAEAAGRDPDAVRLLAVTKGFGVSVVRAALEAGLTSLGENRVQEAIPKVESAPDADWHLVGRLQSNKVRPALRLFRTIHSVDSFELLDRIQRIAHDDGHRPCFMLQVNAGAEAGRAGFAPADLEAAAARLREARGVVGLMTMAPAGGAPDETRAVFRSVRELRDRLRHSTGLELPELSMGMTSDAEEAVAEGATLVRIGTAIFGPRHT
jgi:pyridoxal phosphate enzyme (YggS family)